MTEEDFQDWSGLEKEEIKGLLTEELLEYLAVLEKKAINQTGEATGHPPVSNQTTGPSPMQADKRDLLYDELARRLGVKRFGARLTEWLEDLDERADGMQYAIDQLKKHRHDEKTGKPVRPF